MGMSFPARCLYRLARYHLSLARGEEKGSCFLKNVSYNEIYGYGLAQSSRGVNRLAGSSGPGKSSA